MQDRKAEQRAETSVTKAETIVFKKENEIINELAIKAGGEHPSQQSVDKLFDELERQKKKGKWDEEEQMIGNLEQKKKK